MIRAITSIFLLRNTFILSGSAFWKDVLPCQLSQQFWDVKRTHPGISGLSFCQHWLHSNHTRSQPEIQQVAASPGAVQLLSYSFLSLTCCPKSAMIWTTFWGSSDGSKVCCFWISLPKVSLGPVGLSHLSPSGRNCWRYLEDEVIYLMSGRIDIIAIAESSAEPLTVKWMNPLTFQ